MTSRLGVDESERGPYKGEKKIDQGLDRRSPETLFFFLFFFFLFLSLILISLFVD